MTLITKVTTPTTISQTMVQVLLALMPGLCYLIFINPFGIIANLFWSVSFALLLEAICLALASKPVWVRVKDCSAVVCAVLLAISLPPGTSVNIILVGILCSIGLAKHAYGGLGTNLFNPAMVGYAILLISFPIEMTTRWPSSFLIDPLSTSDATSAATALDALKTDRFLDQVHPLSTDYWNQASVITNGLFLLGGLYLVSKNTVYWHVPAFILVGMALPAIVFDSMNPAFHLLHGATMLSAFFIATDPTTMTNTLKGHMIFGFMIGLLSFIIRRWGHYPDGFAFAVLIMNMCAPLIDYLTQPRHDRK